MTQTQFLTQVERVLLYFDSRIREPGCTDKQQAEILGVALNTLAKWRLKPEFRLAEKMFRRFHGDRAHRSSLPRYIYKHLSPEAKKIWDKLEAWGTTGGSADERARKLLSGSRKEVRQELFVHALIHTNFDLSSACAITATPRNTLEMWKRDLHFRELVEEIQWHKKNFFEHALMDLVEERHPAAVIFVNRTQNADRGYNEKIQIEHSGSVEGGIRIDELDLDIETRRKLLEAIRAKSQGRLENGRLLDIEVTEVGP